MDDYGNCLITYHNWLDVLFVYYYDCDWNESKWG
jgi:hypothetical protein